MLMGEGILVLNDATTTKEETRRKQHRVMQR